MKLIGLARKIIPENLIFPLRYVYSLIPLEKRMGKEYRQLKAFLQEAQWWDRKQIESWQLKKLKEMVHYSYHNVPGYNKLYRDAGIKPCDIVTLADIRFLPFTTKELLRDNLEDFTSQIIPKSKLYFQTTGGSTGVPLGFYHTNVNRWMELAFMHSGWERAGWKLGDKSAVLRGNLAGTRERIWNYNPVSRELQLSSYYLTEQYYDQYIKILIKHAPKHLQAYPSAANLLANLILENNDVGKVSLKTILLGSENIYDQQKIRLSQAFPGAQIFGWYGHTEQNILAPMCEHSDQYHSWPFYGLTEILDNKINNTQEEEIGELVGTSFWSFGTPFIRYRTGDYAKRGKSNCNICNREFDLIKTIEGRKQDYVVTADGGYVTLTALIFAQHFHAFGTTKNMQLYQDKAGELLVKVVPTNEYRDHDSQEIKSKMESAVGGRLKIQVELVDEIPRTQRGKYRFLEQKLDLDMESR